MTCLSSSNKSFLTISYTEKISQESSSELCQTASVGKKQRQQFLPCNPGVLTGQAGPLGELPHRIRAALPAREDKGNRVPAMPLQGGRRGMVSGDCQHVRAEGQRPRHLGIHLLDGGHLGVEVAIFSRGIRPLDMEVDEV